MNQERYGDEKGDGGSDLGKPGPNNLSVNVNFFNRLVELIVVCSDSSTELVGNGLLLPLKIASPKGCGL